MRTMTRRIAAGAASLAVLTGTAVLTGCGSSANGSGATDTVQTANGIETLPARQILEKSLAASKAASSVAVVGQISDEDQRAMSLDLLLGTDASQGTTSFTGFSMEFRVTGGTTYFKISREGIEHVLGAGEGSALIGDRWLLMSSDDTSDTLSALGDEFTSKNAMLTSLLSPDGTVTVKGTGQADGVPVVFIRSSSNPGGTLAIRTVGEPYPVQISTDAANGSEQGTVTFSNWNAPVNVTAPADAVRPEDLLSAGGAST